MPQRGPGHQSQGWLDTRAGCAPVEGRWRGVPTPARGLPGGLIHSMPSLPPSVLPRSLAPSPVGLLSFHHLCLPHLPCPLCPLTCALLLCCCPPIRFLFPVPIPWVTVFPFLSQFPVLVFPPTWPHIKKKLRQPVKLHLPINCSYFSRAIPFSNQLPVGNPDPKARQVLCANQGHLEVGVEGGGLV